MTLTPGSSKRDSGIGGVFPPLSRVDWEALKTFYYVAHAESVTKAASLLGITQSALSRTILTLEQRLKTRLFVRVPRGLILTQAGSLVFEAISEAFPPLEGIRTRLEDEKDPLKGDIHLRMMGGVNRVSFLKPISEFIQKYPEIRLILSVGKGPPFPELLETDIVIGPSFSAHPDWIQVPLWAHWSRLYASRTYIEKFGRPDTPQDLDSHSLLAVRTPLKFEEMNWHLTAGTPSRHPRKARVEVELMEEAGSLAAQGVGIAPAWAEIPTSGHALESSLGSSELVEVLSAVPRPSISLSFMYSAKIPVSDRIHLFKEHLQATVKQDKRIQEKVS